MKQLHSESNAQHSNDGKILGTRLWPRRLRDIPDCDSPRSAPCHSYCPTRQELEQLVRYWQWELIDIAFYCFTADQSGSTELRIAQLCVKKINELELVLGKEVVQEIRNECAEDFRSFVGDEAWQVYLSEIAKEINK